MHSFFQTTALDAWCLWECGPWDMCVHSFVCAFSLSCVIAALLCLCRGSVDMGKDDRISKPPTVTWYPWKMSETIGQVHFHTDSHQGSWAKSTYSLSHVCCDAVIFLEYGSRQGMMNQSDAMLNWLVTPNWLLSKSSWPQCHIIYSHISVMIMFKVETWEHVLEALVDHCSVRETGKGKGEAERDREMERRK